MASIPGTHRVARIWLNLSLSAKGGAIIAIPAICSFCMLGILADLQSKFDTANRWVFHTEQVLSQSREILATVLSGETVAGAYLMTRDPALLQVHRNGRQRVSDGFNQILRLTEDNPSQQEHMRHAMRMMQDEAATLDRLGAQPPASSFAAAMSASRQRLDTLRAEIAAFDEEERRLLNARQQRTAVHHEQLRLSIWGFCIVGALAAVIGSMLFTSGFKRRLDRISANAERFARRDSDGPVDGSPDAIGRLEQTLIATTRTLLDREQLLSENAGELVRAKTEAEASSQAKSEFVATVSHELRSPINAVLGAADLLSDTRLTERQAEYVRMLHRAGTNLLSVIDDVLDLSKIEAGRMELEMLRFDCAAMVDRVVDLLSVTASDKGLEMFAKYAPGMPRFFTGDPNRLQRVLINLVSNAIKFTEMGVVAVKVEPGKADGLVHFSVADTGIGIPRDRQEAIFQKYTQAGSSTTREFGGTGLGLAICRQIVEIMGGRIWVESEPGAGSTFHFTVALEPAAEPAEPPKEAPRQRPAPAEAHANGATGLPALSLRILLAEDSSSNVALIKAYLAGTGCNLDLAADGEIALERLLAGRYNLVLMDVQMPKLDGYEVTRRFREWERQNQRPRTPVVAVTAHAFQEDIEHALKAGADAHLTKPLRRDTLIEAIELYQRSDDAADIRVTVPDFIRELAPEFLRRQRYGLLAVTSALKREEFDPIESFAHNMKGCGRSFGFPRLTDLGRDIEMAAKNRDGDKIRKQVQDLREYLTDVDIA